MFPSLIGQVSAATKSSSSISSQRRTVSKRLKQISSTLSQKRKKALKVKKQVDSITDNLNVIVGQYNKAIEQLERTKASIQENQARLTEAQDKRSECQEIINRRARSIYKHGMVRFLAVFLKVKTYDQFLVRMEMLRKIGEEDAKALSEIKILEEEIISRGQALEEQKANENAIVAGLQSQQKQIQSELVKANNLYAGVKQEIERLEKERRDANQALARLKQLAQRRKKSTNKAYPAVSVSGFVFPINGPHGYSDNFGDYRSGGRTHKGIDIFALKGTPVVAVVNGTVVTVITQRLGGKVIRLKGNDGHIYSYAHLDGYAEGIREGVGVKAGQTIGYVGNTGNALGGAHHLHFEFHPGGGAAVNPYLILRGAD